MAVNVSEVKDKLAAVLPKLEEVLVDAEKFDGFAPAEVRALIAEAAAVIAEVDKFLS